MKKRSLRAGLALLLPMSLTAPTASAHVLVGTVLTPNWSGYALAGSAFRGVTGTFNIPVEITSGSCLDETAVWVGLDGLDNHDLLQAGIVESGFALPTSSGSREAPTPGIRCLRRTQVYAFWEDLPSAPVRVDLPVRMGDLVSVSIFQMSSGWWALAMHDITAGRSFLLSQPYAGPDLSGMGGRGPSGHGPFHRPGALQYRPVPRPRCRGRSAPIGARPLRLQGARGGSELGGECGAADARRLRRPLGPLSAESHCETEGPLREEAEPRPRRECAEHDGANPV